jgi:hypothetical protein
VSSSATGGDGGGKDAASGAGAFGGTASATSFASNSLAGVAASATAVGGIGGFGRNGANSGKGGDATASARGETTGDAHGATATGSATGRGASTVFTGNGSTGANGGNGLSNSTAISFGNSTATANDTAQGGSGSEGQGGTVHGGNGGTANSTASATAGGVAAASATAAATGGAAGARSGTSTLDGRGGNATATANSSGLGQADASATATGGSNVFGSLSGSMNGSALARANSTGASGTAFARAFSGGVLVTSIRADAIAQVGSTVNAEARAAYGSAAPDFSLVAGVEAAAFVTGSPLPADIAVALAGNPNASAAGPVMILGALAAAYPANGSGATKTYTSDLSYSIHPSQLIASTPLRLGFLDPVSSGSGFDTLRLQIFKENVSVFDQTFGSLAAANAFFNDGVLDFGPSTNGVSGSLDLEMLMTYTSHTIGDSFGVDFVTAVPEPGTAILLVAGLGGCIARRRRRS